MRFVSPETVRIDLADGPMGSKNWIEVKELLNVGELKRFRTAGFHRLAQDAEKGQGIEVNWAAMALARVEAYLVDWSATDDKGKPVAVSRQAIEALHPDDFDEIDTAIQAHMDRMEAEKKILNGMLTAPLPPTSSS